MPRLYREAPLASIWEGSGNVISLDVLRALVRTPRSLEVFLARAEAGAGRRPAPGRPRWRSWSRSSPAIPRRSSHARAAWSSRWRCACRARCSCATPPAAVCRRVLRRAPGRRRRPGVRDAAGGHGLRGDHRPQPPRPVAQRMRRPAPTEPAPTIESHDSAHKLPARPRFRDQDRRRHQLVRRAVPVRDRVTTPYFHEVLGARSTTAYLVAVAVVLSFFASVILHELGHALVARRNGLSVAGIDLWAFGGLTRMREMREHAGDAASGGDRRPAGDAGGDRRLRRRGRAGGAGRALRRSGDRQRQASAPRRRSCG